jgi:hypothetical protein
MPSKERFIPVAVGQGYRPVLYQGAPTLDLQVIGWFNVAAAGAVIGSTCLLYVAEVGM